MNKNVCSFENCSLIKALFEGKEIEYLSPYENKGIWQLYSAENEEWNFGPWNCDDKYAWRVKPITVAKEIEITKTVEVKEKLQLNLEGVKEDGYMEGDIIHYVWVKGNTVNVNKNYKVSHSHSNGYNNHVFFETAEYAQKAYDQIQQQLKGN